MNEIIVFEESGCKRKGERAKCKTCNKEFTRRLKPPRGTKKKEHCSVACRSKNQERRVWIKCPVCNKKVERKKSAARSTKHGILFCGRECKEFAQSLEGDCKKIQPSHYGAANGIYSYREKCKKQFVKGCRCGEKKIYKLVVHHKDGNRENNEMSNLEVVCCNCHTVRHLKQVNGVWVFDYSVLTPRSRIKELT